MSLQTDTGLPPAYDVLRVGMALYDPATGAVIDANDRLESLFGYSTADLRTMTADEYSANTYSFSGPELVERIRAAADGDPRRFDWRVKRSDGELIWVRFHLAAFARDGADAVLAEVHDVTDYYDASRRVKLFSRVLRHNLRNEGNVIAGHARRIETATESDRIRRIAGTIRAAAMDLGGITESVGEIEQAAASTETGRSYRDAAVAVREVVDDVRADYPAATVPIEERTRMGIHVDSAFDHALGHAIENAVRHADDPEPIVEITIDASPNTGRVEIRVADRAPPIPEEEIEALDEFTDHTSTSHGSGVGLFAMKWCIESLGGELEFGRREPRGNVVRFYLPPKEPPDGAA